MQIKSYATHSSESALVPFDLQRREVGLRDVRIGIKFCGICHSDIHQVRNEWGNSKYPMVPGHEIVGLVAEVGGEVSRWKVGDPVGVGCFVDSCRVCPSCRDGVEQYCEGHLSVTYNGTEQDKVTPTYGGYSEQIVVDQDYVLGVPKHLPLAGVAPLLCAGITTFSPLRHWRVGQGHKLAVLGLGGLGHMAVKFGAALGAQVTVLSSSPKKRGDAEALGATDFLLHNDDDLLQRSAGTFDFILDTVSAPHDLSKFLNLLKRDGTMILVGASPEPLPLATMPLIFKRRRVVGSLIGGIAETQEMLDFCGEHNIVSDVEMIEPRQINEAYERVLKSDVKYRFVINTESF